MELISHVWNSLSTSLIDYSLSGIDKHEVDESSLWQIKPNSRSTTINVNPHKFDNVTSELTKLYGLPISRGKHGQIYKCNMTHDDGIPAVVTITSYSSTSVLHVQGCLHEIWVDTTLGAIEQKLSSQNDSETLDQSHDVDVSFDTDSSLCPPPTSTSTPMQRKSAFPSTCDANIQTDHQQEYIKLKDTITSLKAQILDYKAQLTQFQELRGNFTHLSTAYRELSDQNSILQAELTSLKEKQSDTAFQTPKTPARLLQSPVSPTTAIQNQFDSLEDEVRDDIPEPAATSSTPSNITPAPSIPPRQTSRKPVTKQTPGKQNTDDRHKQAKPTTPQILIFSNSICKRINGQKFYRGRSTQVFAKAGASIGDVQKLVEDCQYDDPKYVILQAWSNNATREDAEHCESKARTLIETALKKFPSAHIIVSSALPRLIPLTRRDTTNETIKQLNGILEHNCRNSMRVTFTDHTPTFVTRSRQIRDDLYFDHVHLNHWGLGRLVINFRRTIDRIDSYFHMAACKSGT